MLPDLVILILDVGNFIIKRRTSKLTGNLVMSVFSGNITNPNRKSNLF